MPPDPDRRPDDMIQAAMPYLITFAWGFILGAITISLLF
jgi:hypothetical protein